MRNFQAFFTQSAFFSFERNSKAVDFFTRATILKCTQDQDKTRFKRSKNRQQVATETQRQTQNHFDFNHLRDAKHFGLKRKE